MTPTLVQVDSRKRVSLGDLAHHDQYLVREEADGTIIFEPAIVLTATEQAFQSDAKLRETLEYVNAHSEEREPRRTRRTQ